MGSGESHFHVLFIARGKVTRQRPQTTAFQEKGGSAGNRASVVHLTAGPSWPTSVQGVFKRRLLHSRTFLKEFCEKKRSNLKLKIKDFFPPVLLILCSNSNLHFTSNNWRDFLRTSCEQPQGSEHTLSVAFWHLTPNSARFSYTTEGALFISTRLSSNVVSALWKVRVLIWLEAT